MTDTILAKDIIRVTIGRDHTFNCDAVVIGRTGEHIISHFEITLPDELCNMWPYLDFKKPKGETVTTERLDIVDGKIEYDIPNGLLDESGTLEAQLVLKKENGGTWKSAGKKYVVLKSVDADADIPAKEKADFITEAQKVLDDTEAFVAEANEVLKETEELATDARSALEETNRLVAETQETVNETKELVTEAKNAQDETERLVSEANTVLDDTANLVAEAQNALRETNNLVTEANNALDNTESLLTEAQKVLDETEETLENTKKIRDGDAPAIKEIVSGNPVLIDDVSPLEHEMKVSVVGGATVKKYGKNLFNPKQFSINTGETTLNGDVFTTKFTNAAIHIMSKQTFKAGKYTITVIPQDEVALGLFFYDSEKYKSSYALEKVALEKIQTKTTELIRYTFTASSDFIFGISGVSGNYGTYSYKIQLEVNSNASVSYEAYKNPTTYTADENGNVGGIIGNGEEMTLIADEGATITAEYNVDTKKYIDKKFAELQALVLEV